MTDAVVSLIEAVSSLCVISLCASIIFAVISQVMIEAYQSAQESQSRNALRSKASSATDAATASPSARALHASDLERLQEELSADVHAAEVQLEKPKDPSTSEVSLTLDY